MSQYTSYWLYQKYEKRGDQDWLPCYPNVLSVDADGTRQRVIKEENDTGCGYAPEPDAEYRWVQVPISEDYVCDYCPIYRWHEAPVTDYYCSGTTKWTKEYYQVSLDNGVSWNNVVPEQTRKGNTIIEEESIDCGYVPPVLYEWRRITPVSGDDSTFVCDTCCVSQYRWVDLDVSTDYYCSGTTKYYKQQKQVSIDCGESWDWVSPAEYQWGASAQAWSTDCGYVPMERTTSGTPYCSGETGYDKYVDVYSQVSYDGGSTWQTTATTPTLVEAQSSDCGYVEPFKFKATYSDSFSYSAACDAWDLGYLKTGTTHAHNYTAMTTAEVGSCISVIDDRAFQGCASLSSVTIPNSVITIGGGAFAYCTSLPSITIPSGVTSFIIDTFRGCTSLTSISIPSGVTSIGYYTFSGCTSLPSITLPSGVTSIEGAAFEDCTSLTSIVVPSGVTSIDTNVFAGCTGLTSIDIPSGVTSIGGGAFQNCTSLPSIEIPSGVTTIGMSAFASCTSLTSIVIPDSVTSIGDYAFRNCSSLTSVTIGNGVTSIGYYAFSGCTSITSVTIGTGVTYIDYGAFESCVSLSSVTVEATTPPTLSGSTFQDTPIASGTGYIYVPCDSVNAYKTDRKWSYYVSQLQAIPGSCTPMERTTSGTPYCSGETGYDKYVDVYSQISYDNGNTWETTATTPTLVEAQSSDCGYVPPTPTFDGKFRATYTGGTTYSAACDSSTELTSDDTEPSGYDRYSMVTAEIGDCITSIGGEAFGSCTGLTSVTIPDSVTTIDGNYAFANCVRLPSITIPDSVTSIGDGAFYWCTGLASIDIPSGVTSIGSQTFYECRSLTSIDIPDSVTSIGDEAFINCNSLTSIDIPDSVTTIGGDAFFSCDNLASIDIPDSVTSIGDSAFAYCTSLTSCTIGSGVTSVGGNAFFSCYSVTNFTVGSDAAVGVFGGNHSLQNVIIDDNVTSISNSAFTECSSLTSIDIPDSVTSIGNSAFQDCSGLTSCTIGSGVTSIGSSAFRSCDSLTSITIPDSVTSIGGYAFAGCDNLASIDIPDSVTRIGVDAFYHCTNLTSVTIGSGVTSIGNEAFSTCSSLTSITIERKNPPTLNNANAFQGTPIASGTGYIYVKSASVDVYKQANGWKTYKNQIRPIT